MLPVGGTPLYYVEDLLGTSRVITSNTGGVCYDAEFYPFGVERPPYTNSCPQNNYKFEGKERDTETGNDDFGARYYSNRFGRWLSSDWSAIPEPVPYAILTNPQTLNIYTMVGDDHESFADLDGHCNIFSCLQTAATNFEKSMKTAASAAANGYEKAGNAVVTVAKDAVNNLGTGIGEIVGGVASGNRQELDEGVATIILTVVPFLGDAPEAKVESTIGGGEGAAAKPSAVPKEGIYEGPAAGEPDKTYVGQTDSFSRRTKEQQAPGGKIEPGTQVKTTEVLGGKTAREIAEHKRIQELGG
jgi:RHS repeat-associated protein